METNRRRFLQVIGGSMVAACGSSTTSISAKSIALGTVVAVPMTQGYVGRDAGGLYGMSSICKHQNCDTISSGNIKGGNTIVCGCHGSEYDAFGKVTKQPTSGGGTTTDLDHVEVTVDKDGNVVLNTAKIVPAATRTPG